MVQQPNTGLDGVIAEICRSHAISHTNTVNGTLLNELSDSGRGR